MTRIAVAPDLRVHCVVDDYLWPWQSPLPVLMVHGFSRSAAIWTRWMPVVTGSRRAYRLDLRGCGESDVPPPEYKVTLDMVFGDILTVLDHFHAEKAHLVGESSSGQFLFAFSVAHPDRVASLTMCETTPRMQQWVFDAYRLDAESPPAAIRKYGTGEWCRRTLAYRLDKDHASPELSQWLVRLMGKTPSHVAAAMIDCFFGIDNHPLLSRIPVPVLQLTGSEKTATNVEEQKMIHRTIPRSRLKIFEGYRGMIHLFEAERCAQEAVAFWDDVDRGALP